MMGHSAANIMPLVDSSRVGSEVFENRKSLIADHRFLQTIMGSCLHACSGKIGGTQEL
jgi:hypothetical protein